MPKQLFLGGEIGETAEEFERECVVPMVWNIGEHGEKRNLHVLIDSNMQRALCGSAFCRERFIVDRKKLYPSRYQRTKQAWQLTHCKRCLVAVKHRHSGVLPPLQIYAGSLDKPGQLLLENAGDGIDRWVMRRQMERDPSPWLVFADWLDEQGDERGELLRVMVEVCQRNLYTPATHYVRLVTRAWELFEQLAETGG